MWPSFVSLPLVSLCFWPELGTRHHCCDNVTLLSDHKIVGYCIVCISVVDTPFIRKILTIFICLLVTEAVLRGCIVAVLKLNNCRMPSSQYWHYTVFSSLWSTRPQELAVKTRSVSSEDLAVKRWKNESTSCYGYEGMCIGEHDTYMRSE